MPKSKKEEVLENLWGSLNSITQKLNDHTYTPETLKQYSKIAERVAKVLWDVMNLPKE